MRPPSGIVLALLYLFPLAAQLTANNGWQRRLQEIGRQGSRKDEEVPVRLDASDRNKHVYVLGKTGSGKTNFLKNFAADDTAAGGGVAVIDPHGELVDHLLPNIGDRVDDTVLLDFSDPDYLPVVNPLLLDVAGPEGRAAAIADLIDIVVHRNFSQWTGPVFEDNAQLVFSTLWTDALAEIIPHPSLVAGVSLLRTREARTWVAYALAGTSERARRWLRTGAC
jgi:DNA helicase HerA-like ATPase